MNLLLFEDVPLRTTKSLGDFASDVPLAERFGDLTESRFTLHRLSDTEFVAAGHPMEITGAFIDDQATASWEASLQSDTQGRTWTIVTYGAPVPKDGKASASGRGKRNPFNGALLENPADICEAVMRLSGRTDTFGQLREESAKASLRIAGSIEVVRSIKTQIDEITQSVAAIWSFGMSRLYPVDVVDGAVIDLEKLTTSVSSPPKSATIADTADILRLGYGLSTATGKAQNSIELTASPQRFGGVVSELMLPWLWLPANAESVGRRLLGRLAGERYTVELSTERIDLRPGQWVRLVALPEWPFTGPDPVMMVLEVQLTPGTKSAAVVAEFVRSVPTITVTAHSVALPDTSGATIEVRFQAGIATFSIHNKDDKPVAGARVSLDGGAPKTTDSAGRVAFATTKGLHRLELQAIGMVPVSMDIDL